MEHVYMYNIFIFPKNALQTYLGKSSDFKFIRDICGTEVSLWDMFMKSKNLVDCGIPIKLTPIKQYLNNVLQSYFTFINSLKPQNTL